MGAEGRQDRCSGGRVGREDAQEGGCGFQHRMQEAPLKGLPPPQTQASAPHWGKQPERRFHLDCRGSFDHDSK